MKCFSTLVFDFLKKCDEIVTVMSLCSLGKFLRLEFKNSFAAVIPN
jgi:hypothetical protein